MGYFSRLACEHACREDRSYPSPEIQLVCRILELEGRLTELSEVGFAFSDDRLSAQEIETVLPEHLSRAKDLYTALAIAKQELLRMEEQEMDNGGPAEQEPPYHQLEFNITDMLNTGPLLRAA